ncbi:MAG TPA: L-threonylcarbamoyladenylate synthase [Acidobacteriaceae bacterium]
MGKTLRLRAEDAGAVAAAAEILRGGGLVAFPTETVYGLGANALNPDAVEKIFAAKQRPHWDPLIVHVTDLEMVRDVAEVSPLAERLAGQFWPGPLTMLLPRTACVPDVVTAGRALVGVRVPRHSLALALIEAAGVPVAAPSANRFGHTSPTTAKHVLEDLDGFIDAVLDGGAAKVGVESTVVDVSLTPMRIYRPGAVTAAMLGQFGAVEMFAATDAGEQVLSSSADSQRESMPAPGVGLRHYAPKARVVLVERKGSEDLTEFWYRFRRVAAETQGKVGLMLPERFTVAEECERALIYRWGEWTDTAALAARLFAGLRELDARGATVIVCPVPAADGIGDAVRDRLFKAAMREG